MKRDPELEKLQRHAGDEAELGIKALEDFWKTLTKKQQLKLKSHMSGFKARAADVDAGGTPAANENTDLEDPFGATAAAE